MCQNLANLRTEIANLRTKTASKCREAYTSPRPARMDFWHYDCSSGLPLGLLEGSPSCVFNARNSKTQASDRKALNPGKTISTSEPPTLHSSTQAPASLRDSLPRRRPALQHSTLSRRNASVDPGQDTKLMTASRPAGLRMEDLRLAQPGCSAPHHYAIAKFCSCCPSSWVNKQH